MDDNIYNPEFVKRLFNKMSASYERMNYITSFGFSIRWRRQFLNHLNSSNEPVEIIDLLSGMGETWKSIKKRFPNSKLSALDFSIEMLKNAKKDNAKHFNNEITIHQQDLLANSLPSNHYDIVICAFGLKTFSDEQLAVLATETKRILKNGGEFSFVEVSKPKNVLLHAFYGLYLGKIIPVLGRLFLGNPSEYKMLWLYTEKFKNSQKAVDIFESAGLTTRYDEYFFGCATGIYGQKKI